MSPKSALVSRPLSKRLEGAIFAFLGKWQYPPQQSIATLIDALGGKLVEDVDSSVTHLVCASSDSKAAQKTVQQLNKKGSSVTLIGAFDFDTLVRVTKEDATEILKSGNFELWSVLDTLVLTLDCQNVLCGTDLSNADLRPFQLGQAVVRDSIFKSANLESNSFNNPTRVNFDDANLVRAQLEDAKSCSFKKCSFTNGGLSGKIVDCDFSQADLSKLDAISVHFLKCKFCDANLTEAALDTSELKNCELAGCNFSRASLTECDFGKSDLSGVKFTGANLAFTSFSDAKLTKADFRNAILCGANFKGADLTGADFTGAAVKGAVFSGARMIEKAVGLEIKKETSKPKLKEALAKIDQIAATTSVFTTDCVMVLNSIRFAFRIHSLSKGAQVSIYPGVEDGPSFAPMSSKSVSAGLIELAKLWSDGALEIDEISATSPKKLKEDLNGLAIAAWHEAFGLEVPTEAQVKQRAQEKAALVENERSQLVGELKGGASGIKAWNERTAKDKENRSLIALSGQDFSRTDLSGAALVRVDFDECNFKNAVFRGGQLVHSRCIGACFEGAIMDGADLRNTDFEKCSFVKATLVKANLSESSLVDARFVGADLTDANLTEADLKGADLSSTGLTGTVFDGAEYDEKTKFPNSFSFTDKLRWWGKGPDPYLLAEAAKKTASKIDFDEFIKALQQDFDQEQMKKVLKMLKADRFELYADVSDDLVTGVVKSQTDESLVYSCRLAKDGTFACCTQNTNVCGGLRGSVCKHILVLTIGVIKAGRLDATTALKWVLSSRAQAQKKLDKDVMAETLLKYKGCEAGEIDWRPTETMPEDYYAF